MNITIIDGLPFTTVRLTYHGKQHVITCVLIDTGSGGSVFSTDILLSCGIHYEMNDMVHRIRGVGGTEFVFSKVVDQLAIGNLIYEQFTIEVGVMDYGIPFNGIIGMDFLYAVNAVIDLAHCQVFANKSV
ncbi:hypothetical protein CSA56_18955 [candidate division KSB3 bacterium]|uniref:Peptidase A2 domain-containing protein n=1 Tax=candidate division KSB3 bacterium TaxID=2044937 RepID=A0A2G6K6D3_9BACT|nr:MAG: hypothetical protein CSA56_18955 [candidate division KSB3 bacterium]